MPPTASVNNETLFTVLPLHKHEIARRREGILTPVTLTIDWICNLFQICQVTATSVGLFADSHRGPVSRIAIPKLLGSVGSCPLPRPFKDHYTLLGPEL